MARDLYSLRVKDVMSRDVVTISPNDSLHESLQLMVENKVAAVPVIDHRDRCVGMLSSSDFLQITRELDSELSSLDASDIASERWLLQKLHDGVGNDKVSEHMTENVASISSEAALSEAAQQMLRNRVHRLPVIDGNNRLVGIVSTMDVLRAFAEGAA